MTNIAQAVPYFERLFSELSFDPARVQSLSDLARLPLMDKRTIRENTAALKATNANALKQFNTGGSSGEPLVFFLGNERVSHDVAAKRRATRWWGVDIGDPEIVVWGSPIELSSQDYVRVLRDKLFRTELISAFDMSEDNLQRYLDRIKQFRPKMLFGYPSSLALMAKFATDHNLSMSGLGIKVAFVTSERLYDHQKEAIESAFGCPVANGYGGRDAGFIAHACPEGSLHITAEDIVVEIIDDAGNILPAGHSGEIVITHLFTRDFPFVRYRTGDIGMLATQPCSCGRGLPVLADIEGRTTDFVIAADGTVLHGLALIYVLREIPDLEAFRIIQESKLHTTVQVVAGKATTEGLDVRIQAKFRERLGAAVHVSVEYVDEIPREKSGKFRYVVSHVDQSDS